MFICSGCSFTSSFGYTAEDRDGSCENASELKKPNCPNGLSTIRKKELLERLLRPDIVLKAVVLGPFFLISFFSYIFFKLAGVGACI